MRSIVPLFAFAFAASAPAVAAEHVPVPAFRSVELHGGGSVLLRPAAQQRVTLLEGSTRFTRLRVNRDGELRISICEGRCPRYYRLRVLVEGPQVPDVAITGGGSITAAGGFSPQRRLSAGINGGGSIDLRSVAANDVSAAVNGGGSIAVRPRARLNAAVNGGGAIRYWGDPQVTMAVHGGGTVTRAY